MRILELTNYTSGGCGVWSRVKQESELFSQRGHEVMILSSNIEKGSNKTIASEDIIYCQQEQMGGVDISYLPPSEKGEITGQSLPSNTSSHTPADIKIFRYPAVKLGGESFMYWFKGEVLKKALEFKPDIIIAHNYRHLHTTSALQLAKKVGAKCFLVTHAPFNNSLRTNIQEGVVNLYDKTIGRLNINKFDKILAISHWEVPYLLKIGAEKERIFYSPNGIPEEFFSLPNQAEEENKILFLGRVSPKKKIETIIQAIQYLKDKNLIIEVVGPQEEEYMKELRKLKDFNRIIFSPAIYDLKEKIKKIDSCKIYILASRVEGMPQGLIEAMVRGKTVISTDSIAIRDLITDGDNGYLFEFNNPKSLAEKINYAISNPIDGSDSIKSFNWNILIKELELLWK